jgi:putative protein-disulfide isomerase
MATLIYGYDPICGWCYGAAPALRAAAQVMPVRLVMAGLVTGPRVGPAAAMEDYVRHAATRLRAVTGRAPSEAFYAWMRSPGAMAASGPPAVAVHAVQEARPDAALDFAHALTEAHYEEGLDPNDPAAYAPLLARFAPGVALPDIHEPARAEAAFAEGRRLGIAAFPTLLLDRGDAVPVEVPMLYDSEALVARLRQEGVA